MGRCHPDAVDAAIREAEAALPPIGAIVNNAGITSPTRLVDVTPAEWDRVFEADVRGSFLVMHRVVSGMAERGFGGVVCSTAKAALLGFARPLAREILRRKAAMIADVPVRSIGGVEDVAAVIAFPTRPGPGIPRVNGGSHIHRGPFGRCPGRPR
ncbi:SDR family NAD(P)-dependent oxidoreductase [Streptomyces sp. NPDC021098]|uniref:SDR family NAD(P)-dependent oxidoreductase n=1 Tax=unclassified Streptomyces TaxID=2593676 RepID=UPI0037AA71E5